MIVKCVVAGNNFEGPNFYFCNIECTQEEYDNDDHYDTAITAAEAEGYDSDSIVVFDEFDGPAWLFEHFVWSTADLFCVDGEDVDED